MLVFSCKKKETRQQVYFDSLFANIDSLAHTVFGHYNEKEIKLLDAAYATIKEPSREEIFSMYYYKLNYYWAAKHAYDSAILYTDSAIAVLQNNLPGKKNVSRYTDMLFMKGDIYLESKKYDEAILAYIAAKLSMPAKNEDHNLLCRYYNCMGNILYTQKKYLLAAPFYKLVCSTAPSCNKKPEEIFYLVQGNLDNAGLCYDKAGLKDSAIYYFNTALDYINANEKDNAFAGNFVVDRCVVYGNMAEVLKKQKNLQGAEDLFLKSLALISTPGFEMFNRTTQLSLAEIYLQTNQLKKVSETLDNLTSPIKMTDINHDAFLYHKLLSGYYLKTNQVAAANTSLQYAYYIKDSLQKRDRRFDGTDVGMEFEIREQNVLSQTLKKDNKIKAANLLTAIVSATMTIVIVLTIWYNLKRKSVYAEKLNALNKEVNRKNNDLQKTLASLEQSHNDNNRIMRVVAHDLKNPISAIRLLIFSLLKKEQTENTRDALNLIQSTCIDSVTLIKDLLENKRNIPEISKELVDMGRLIEQCTELFQHKAGEKNQHIKLKIDYPVMMLNRQRILRVISNIVTNAIKFSPEDTEITILLERKDNTVLFSVRDNGIGIPQNLKERLFAPGDSEITRPGTAGEESYGLGLAISRKIIEEHAGQLWFESEVGKGSVFYVELPYG